MNWGNTSLMAGREGDKSFRSSDGREGSIGKRKTEASRGSDDT